MRKIYFGGDRLKSSKTSYKGFDTLWVDHTIYNPTGETVEIDTMLDTRRGIDKRKK